MSKNTSIMIRIRFKENPVKTYVFIGQGTACIHNAVWMYTKVLPTISSIPGSLSRIRFKQTFSLFSASKVKRSIVYGVLLVPHSSSRWAFQLTVGHTIYGETFNWFNLNSKKRFYSIYAFSLEYPIKFTVGYSINNALFSLQWAIQFTVCHSVFSGPFDLRWAIQFTVGH